MANNNNTVTTAEAILLELADLIIRTYGNSAADLAVATDPVEVDEVEAEEADANSIEEERDELMTLSIGEIRKRLIAAGFEAEDVKKEKSKATLVDALLADMYDLDEDEDPEEDEEDEEDEDSAEDIEDDDAEDEEDDEEDDESDDDEDEDDESDDDLYTEDELSEMSLNELKAIAQEWELEVKKGARQKTYIAAILEAQEAEEDEDEAEDEDDERAELEALSLADLKKAAKNDYGVSVKEMKGLDKDAILDLIFEDDLDEDDE